MVHGFEEKMRATIPAMGLAGVRTLYHAFVCVSLLSNG